MSALMLTTCSCPLLLAGGWQQKLTTLITIWNKINLKTLFAVVDITSHVWSGSPRTILRYLLQREQLGAMLCKENQVAVLWKESKTLYRQGAWEKSKACRQSEGFLVHCLSSVYTKKVSMDPIMKVFDLNGTKC